MDQHREAGITLYSGGTTGMGLLGRFQTTLQTTGTVAGGGIVVRNASEMKVLFSPCLVLCSAWDTLLGRP